MIRVAKAALIAMILWIGASAAQAASPKSVEARIDKTAQTMAVYVDGWHQYTWPVSTARRGKITPSGRFTAQWLSKNHRSSRYDNAPMPYSIFYSGHYAVHGTNQISRLGRPASAGCVRLHPDNARILFDLTRQVGKENMTVIVRD